MEKEAQRCSPKGEARKEREGSRLTDGHKPSWRSSPVREDFAKSGEVIGPDSEPWMSREEAREGNKRSATRRREASPKRNATRRTFRVDVEDRGKVLPQLEVI